MNPYLEELLRQVCQQLEYTYPEGVIIAEPPVHIGGDFSVNIAMVLAKIAGTAPRAIAEEFKEKLAQFEEIGSVEVAGPGFLNIQMADSSYLHALHTDTTNIPPAAQPKKISVEYVSANPSGPVHIGNARGGPIGETVVRVLQALGNSVFREFYVNDIGGQANKFSASVLHYYLEYFQVPSVFPDKGYPAPYVKELGEEIAKTEGDAISKLPAEERVEAMRPLAIQYMLNQIKQTTDHMGIHYDRWFFQSSVVQSGRSLKVLERLKANNATMEKEGAIWLKSGILEGDRETVLLKSDGTTGYFLDDIAYHEEKFLEQGFDTAIVMLGANHSGHIPRMRAGIQGIGIDPERYQGVMYQYVQLKEGEETRRMAKREGTFVTADQVLQEVPLEVFNFFMLSKANETHLDFDLQLAKDTSEKNPIYYIQYAHARICSVLARAKEGVVGELPQHYEFSPEERRLLIWLERFAPTVQEIGDTFRTHILPHYLHELASRYHHFYAYKRIVTDNTAETAVRVRLSELTAATLRKGLDLLNITALEKM